MAELERGATFAGHRIEGVAGRGGFGVVYRATHLALDHVVALKLISTGRDADETFRDRFKSESRIAVSIRHPNVVAVHHAGEEDGLLFVTMDFIEGTDLRGLLNREGRLPPERAVAIVRQVSAALDAAHERGLVHRDIKPGNVLIEQRGGAEHVYLTDFGLSKQMDATSGVTASGAFVGTLDYVAPEQIRGDRLDARTDVYALACVMFELLSGEVPFGQEEKVAKIYAHLQEQPPELIDAAPEVPAALSEVAWRAMAKDPEARHPSAGDFARAAAAAVEGRSPSEPERNVGVGAAAPTQAYDVLAAAAAGAAAGEPATAEAAQDPQTADAVEGQTAASAPQTAETTPPETVAVPPPAAEPPTTPDAPRPTTKAGGRRRLLAIGVVAAAVAAGAFVLLSGGGDGGEAPGEGGNDARGSGTDGLTVDEVASVAPEPVGVAIGGGQVWVSSRNGEALTPLDAESREPGVPIRLGGEGEQVAVAPDGDVWVAVGKGEDAIGSVLHLDSDGKQIADVPVGTEPRGIAVGEDAAWVANLVSGHVTKISTGAQPDTSEITAGSQPARVAIGEQAVWVTNSLGNSVTKITDGGAVQTTIAEVGANPRGIVVADGSVWVALQDANQVAQINPATESVVETIKVGDEPRSIAADSDSLWVTNGVSANVTRINLETLDTQTITDVGPDPEGIAVDENGNVWVTSGGESESAEGTIHVIQP